MTDAELEWFIARIKSMNIEQLEALIKAVTLTWAWRMRGGGK